MLMLKNIVVNSSKDFKDSAMLICSKVRNETKHNGRSH